MSSIKLPSAVIIREVGPREGLQIFHDVVPTPKKLELITALAATGLQEIEVTSFVRPDRVPQLADAEAVVTGLPTLPSVQFSALYLNRKGFERAEALGRLHNRGWLYTSPSETFLKANSNTSIEESLSGVAEWCGAFKAHKKSAHGLMVSNAFGCAYEGTIKPHAVVELVKRYQQAVSAKDQRLVEVCLADTVGLAHPGSVEALVSQVRDLGVTVSIHLHDTRGLGIANAYAALQAGVSIFESSVGGVGGCPFTPGAAGNIATEDFVYLCHSLSIGTGISLERLCDVARLVESIMGQPLPGRVYRTSRRHGSC